jgi:hypothetical protein
MHAVSSVFTIFGGFAIMRVFPISALLLSVALLSGCAGLSVQRYGALVRGHQVSTGASKADVLAGIGEPDAIHAADEGYEAYIYRGLKGANYFGLYAKTKRIDTIVVFSPQGIAESVTEVDYGMGHTFFAAPAFLDATHPVPTRELYLVGERKAAAN